MSIFDGVIYIDGMVTSSCLFATLVMGLGALMGMEFDVWGLIILGNVTYCVLFKRLKMMERLHRITEGN